jgi:murein L,D-transpeptidase YafK
LTLTRLIAATLFLCVISVNLWPQTPIEKPRIIVYKKARKLELYSGKSLVRTYRVGLGFNPVADKQREGDGATPEGDFYVFVKNNNSAY